MAVINFANKDDIKYLEMVDDIKVDRIKKKIDRNEILIMKDQENYIGYLRFSYFWDKIPFMDHLVLDEKFRGKGFGTSLVEYWENIMKEEGYKYVMTSTEAGGIAQHFYRKLGYKDIGTVIFSRFVKGEPDQELFLMKTFE